MTQEQALLKEEILRISGVNPLKCMRCGKCTATCPAYDERKADLKEGEAFYPPHQFVYMVEKGEIQQLLKSPSLYRCLSCFACLERCPRQVEPAKLVAAVRVYAERLQQGDHITPETLPADEDLPQQALVSAFRKFKK